MSQRLPANRNTDFDLLNRDISSADEDLTIHVQEEHKRPMPKQKVLQTGEEDLLLETAEGITHRGENLVLFENPNGSDTGSDEKQATPESTSASKCSSPGKIPASCGEENLISLLNGEKAENGPGKCAAVDNSHSPTPGSSISADLIIKDNHAPSPHAGHLDEPFSSEKVEVGILEDGTTREDSQWEESDDSDGEEEVVEVHVDNKGSYLDRLNKLIGG